MLPTFPTFLTTIALDLRGSSLRLEGTFVVATGALIDRWFAGVLQEDQLQRFTDRLDQATSTLAQAVARNTLSTSSTDRSSTALSEGVSSTMPNPVLDALASSVSSTVGVMASAEALITGFAARLQAAVDKALENGATAEQLAPVTDEIAALNAGASSLAQAVAANPGA